MKTDHAEGRNTLVSEDVARSALDKLLADTRFRVTERGKSIIKYIAAHYFSGSLDGIKGYTIAIDVLGRPSNFDPAIDPIVRIELSRLRTALFQYYEAYGHELDTLVEIPRGKYTISFEHRDRPLKRTGGEPERLIPPQSPAKAHRAQSKPNINVTLLIAAALATSLVAANHFNAPLMTTKPSISISMQAIDNSLSDEASQVRDALLSALTQFSTLSVHVTNLVNGPSPVSDYEITLKYYQDEGANNVWWSIRDVRSSQVLKSGIASAASANQSASNNREELASILAGSFAASRSVINLSELEKSQLNDLGNVCVLRTELIMERIAPDNIRDVRSCLELTLQSNPNDSDANAALAQLLVISVKSNNDPSAVERSEKLARHAVLISPMSDRAQTAMMLTQFYSGKVDAAIDTGQKAVAINPNNPATLGLFAWISFATGNWQKAIELANAGGRVQSVAPTSAQLVFAFDAYRQQDWPRAAMLAEQVNSQGKLTNALRIAALGQMGSPEGYTQLNEAQSRDADFVTEVDKQLGYEHMRTPVRQMMLQGLHKAARQIALH